MTLPVIWQQDATQIRMLVKDHPEKIVSLSLVPIRCAPDAGNAGNVRIVFIEQHLQSDAVMFGSREQVIVDFEPRLFLGSAIESAKVSQEIKFQPWSSFEKATSGDDVFARHDDGGLAEGLHNLDDPFLMFTL